MYPEALNYLSKARDAYAKLGNLRNLGIVHGIIAWVYQNLGMHPEWLKHEYESLKIYEKVGDRHGMAIIYGNLADGYAEQGDYETAIKTLRESLKIKLEFDDFINAANGYYEIGNYFLQLKNYPEVLKNQQQALEIGKKTKDNNILGRAYRAIGAINMEKENYAEALKNMQLSIAAFRAVNNKMQLVNLYTELGSCCVKINRLDEARAAFNQARALIEELKSTPEQNTYYRTVVQLDSATGNWKAAFDHYKLYVQTRDSMYNEENTKKIVQTRMQYAFDKKEAAAKAEQEKREALANEELRRQKLMRNGFMGGFAVVLLFAGVFFYQRNRIKKGKMRSDELLLNNQPAEVADELKAKGSADAKLIDEVTVLFSDFKDFTQLSETLTPGELVAEINACFSAFDLIMPKQGVEKLKTVGDAYLGAGGVA